MGAKVGENGEMTVYYQEKIVYYQGKGCVLLGKNLYTKVKNVMK